ncbi:hypothetical protein QVD17_01103 [Tagetes erecta]|uniref:Cyclin-dependent kinase inhibitor domain-containing protein n=1 Tax=Tagetes erecta TaxID=13708 RepID=A0AAD8LBI5_TARER|nr:hypothetical protein QVD17_01103 [Tagetes erecta]
MELPGVLTRAKTLALQKATSTATATSSSSSSSSSYIQLRSRRLVKPNSPIKHKHKHNSLSTNLPPLQHQQIPQPSFGENQNQIQPTGRRTTRETTPCSLIRDPDAIKAPGSSTKSRRRTETKYSVEDTTSRHIPSTSEMDEFFTGPEKQQQRLFIEKYNFDPVNDKPLPGRYEWVKLDATKKS